MSVSGFDPHDPRQRYHHDPTFHGCVDDLTATLKEGMLTAEDVLLALALAVEHKQHADAQSHRLRDAERFPARGTFRPRSGGA